MDVFILVYHFLKISILENIGKGLVVFFRISIISVGVTARQRIKF